MPEQIFFFINPYKLAISPVTNNVNGVFYVDVLLTFVLCFFSLYFSTLVQVLRAQVRLWPRPAPVWRSFVHLLSLSVMAMGPATTTATLTASGWPLSNSLTCSGKHCKILYSIQAQCSLVNSQC